MYSITKRYSIIIVGGGLTGLRAALESARYGVKALIFSKVYPLRSHSVAAQGGVNVSLGNSPEGVEDSWEAHALDTIKGGDYLNDQNAVAVMCGEAVPRILELEEWGCPFSRTEKGLIAQRPFGGGTFPRTAFAEDRTGHAMLNTLYEQCMRAKHDGLVEFYDEWHVLSLIIHEEICCGIIAYRLSDTEIMGFTAGAVILATGGAGRIYLNSTNALINTGMGMSIGYRAGVPLKDMEFIQFHPTTLYGTNILITEGARGEGGVLLNKFGHRYLSDYGDSSKAMEVAPRDIVARNTIREIRRGNGIDHSYMLLDLRHLGERKIKERLPGIRELSIKFAGIDPIENPVPVQPGQHYTMGGIDVNCRAETVMYGLYAAGEAACVSVHGANRLGGNSLLETIVFGTISGRCASEYAKSYRDVREGIEREYIDRERQRIARLFSYRSDKRQWDIWDDLKKTMMYKVGIFRTRTDLADALGNIRRLIDEYEEVGLSSMERRMNMELFWALELSGSLIIAEAVVMGALAREESRGSHFREDFTERDDDRWMKHTLVHYRNGNPSVSYRDVDTSLFKAQERKY